MVLPGFSGLSTRIFGGLKEYRVLRVWGVKGWALSAAVGPVFCVESPWSCQGLGVLRTWLFGGLRSRVLRVWRLLVGPCLLPQMCPSSLWNRHGPARVQWFID